MRDVIVKRILVLEKPRHVSDVPHVPPFDVAVGGGRGGGVGHPRVHCGVPVAIRDGGQSYMRGGCGCGTAGVDVVVVVTQARLRKGIYDIRSSNHRHTRTSINDSRTRLRVHGEVPAIDRARDLARRGRHHAIVRAETGHRGRGRVRQVTTVVVPVRRGPRVAGVPYITRSRE